MSTTAVQLVDVSKRYGSVTAVDHVDLEVADGEFFSMLGPSGSGKTTCLRMIAGFEKPTSGTVELHGHDVSRKAPFERDVNTVFQDYALFPHMTVTDNVGYGLRIRKVAKSERSERVADALAMVRLDGLGDRRPAQLLGRSASTGRAGAGPGQPAERPAARRTPRRPGPQAPPRDAGGAQEHPA